MTRLLTLLIALILLAVPPVHADKAGRMAEAVQKMRGSAWDDAAAIVAEDGAVAQDIVEWHRLRAGLGSYDEVAAFLERRPDWPGLEWLRRKNEHALDQATPDQVLAFFGDEQPQTAEGTLSYARALIAKGEAGEAEASLVLAWRTMPMGSKVQAEFLRRHKDLVKPHHNARLDRLLWDKHRQSTARTLPLADDGHRALAEARLALQRLDGGVDTLIGKVPEELQSAPGLAHDRFEWRIRKNRREDAKLLLLERSQSADLLGEPDKWARRRRDLARHEMRNGDPARAYEIASRHYLVDGSDFADLEWLSGYLALRYLNDPASALFHFQRFDGAVFTPISKGRAGYWIGRAHEALGDEEKAQAAYKYGAQYQTSFYGLLAAEEAGLPFDPALATPPQLPPWREAAFLQSSVFEAGLLLLAAGDLNLAERFLTHLAESLPSEQIAQLGLMSMEMNHAHLAVMIGKRAARQGIVVVEPYYALHPVGEMELPMAPEMNLAIARRESEFDPIVVSGAGARGLMQVMPATARNVASGMGILAQHSTDRLLTEWRYNAKLGANYLAGLAATFDGNVVMMSAGYNAGPGRPIRWMDTYGDPRAGGVDIVDWIEHIPFNETRNYVMRVTESLPVYRARLGQPALPIPFTEELTGSTLSAFAP
ncbi:MAG: lytic transglycosylase domain-containing protein [Paracoccaceae bacterium]